jgi:hypothetical protein
LIGRAASNGQPSVSFDPTELKQADVAADKATVKLTGRSINAEAKLGSVDLVDSSGAVAAALTPSGVTPGMPEGSFEATYTIPKSVAAGEYRVILVLNDGPVVTSLDKLRIRP